MAVVFECIKGFQVEGSDYPIFQGERFVVTDKESMVFESIKGKSVFPEIKYHFSNEVKQNNFKFLHT